MLRVTVRAEINKLEGVRQINKGNNLTNSNFSWREQSQKYKNNKLIKIDKKLAIRNGSDNISLLAMGVKSWWTWEINRVYKFKNKRIEK